MLLDYMCDDLLLIVPSNIKEKIIKKISSYENVYDYKIIDENDLKESLFFSYDIEAINYLICTYNLKPEIAKNYLDSMLYIENKHYESNRLNDLLKIKNEMFSKELLTKNNLFLSKISNKKIIVYGFDVISKEMKLSLKKLGKAYQIVNNQDNVKKIETVYKFETLEDEVEGLCKQISTLLNNGININDIKIANINDDYKFTLKRYFDMYNIPLEIKENESLYNLICVKEFLNYFHSNNNLEESLNFFKEKYPNEKEIYKSLLQVCNKVVTIDDKNNVLVYLLKNASIPQKKHDNVVRIINLKNYLFDENEYVFVLSINQGIYPKSHKDEDFLSDLEKKEIGIDTSEDLNLLCKKEFKIMLQKSKNIILSYKEKSPFNGFVKSFALVEENIKDVNYIFNLDTSFSSMADELKLAKIYDKIFQKNEDEYVSFLANSYEIPYKEYDHKFKKFPGEKIKKILVDGKKKMSYSSIDDYFSCGFKFYLKRILNIGKTAEGKQLDIGNIFHEVLELSYQNEFDFDKEYDIKCQNIDDLATSFYLKKLKPVLKDIIQINNENMNQSQLKDIKTEEEVIVKYDKPIPIIFKGVIDKILYTVKDGKTYVAIIDYKTGNPEIDISKIKYGLSLQLPIYLYLLKHTKKLKDVVVCGIYLQKLMPEKLNANEDGYQVLKKSIKLQGYSNSSISILSMLDMEHENNSFIKSMRVTKDGEFSKGANVISSEEMEEISKEVEEKIQEALDDICNCNFDINPKSIKKKLSCAYCEFNECCFKEHSDIVYYDTSEQDGDEDGN